MRLKTHQYGNIYVQCIEAEGCSLYLMYIYGQLHAISQPIKFIKLLFFLCFLLLVFLAFFSYSGCLLCSLFPFLRSYLETLLSLPWSETTPDVLDINKAREDLDNDHYGHDEVKKRILEYLAVRKLKNSLKG